MTTRSAAVRQPEPASFEDDLVVRSRALCGVTTDADGTLHCRCGTVLADPLRLSCDDCRARAHREEVARRRAATDQRERDRIDERVARIPHTWPWCRVDSAEFAARVEERLRRVAAQWQPARGSLLLLAPSGAGKTSCLVALAHRMASEASATLEPEKVDFVARTSWTSALDLTRAMRAYRLGSGGEPELVEEAVGATLLMLDELGPEQLNPVVFDVIQRRYERALPTLVTSGLTRDEFCARYGDALFRRLTERGIGALVDLHAGSTGG